MFNNQLRQPLLSPSEKSDQIHTVPLLSTRNLKLSSLSESADRDAIARDASVVNATSSKGLEFEQEFLQMESAEKLQKEVNSEKKRQFNFKEEDDEENGDGSKGRSVKGTEDQRKQDAEKGLKRAHGDEENGVDDVGGVDDYDGDNDRFESSGLQGSRCRRRLRYYLLRIFAFLVTYPKKIMATVFTVIFGVVAWYFEYWFGARKYAGIPVWRFMFYLTSLFPSWIIAEWLLIASIMLIHFISYIGTMSYSVQVTSDEIKVEKKKADVEFQRSLHDTVLYFQKYSYHVVLVFWWSLLTLSWALSMSPKIFPNKNDNVFEPGETVVTNWDRDYLFFQRLHLIALLYCLGVVFVDFIVYKYLHQFSAKHHISKIFASLMQQIILLGLSGSVGARFSPCTYLLPDALYKNGTADSTSQNRMEHASMSYVIANKLEKVFAIQLGIASDQRKDIELALLKRIRYIIKRQREKTRLAREAQEEEARELPALAAAEAAEYGDTRRSATKENAPSHLLRTGEETRQRDSEIRTSENVQNEPEPEKVDLNEHEAKKSISSLLSEKHLLEPFEKDPKYSESYSALTTPIISKRKEVPITRDMIKSILYSSFGDEINMEEALNMLDDKKLNDVSMRLIAKFITKAFEDRNNLILSLTDAATVTDQIQTGIQIVVNAVVLLLALLIFRINVLEAWVSYSSIILGFSFVFGGTLSAMFENIVFLYVSHPYDVGDMIFLVDDIYTVKRVLWQTTEIEDLVAQIRTVQNTRISKMEPLINLTQSKGFWLESYFVVDADAINDDMIAKITAELKQYVATKPEVYDGYVRIDYCDFQPPLKVKLMLGVQFSIPQMAPGVCRQAQSVVAMKLIQGLKKYGAYKYTSHVSMQPGLGAETR